jgi:hypothetical protein
MNGLLSTRTSLTEKSMRKKTTSLVSFSFSLIFLFPTAAIAGQSSGIPEDVKQFIEKRDVCDHFRGEPHYDEERSRFLEKQVEKYCTGTNMELLSLKAKYMNNPAIIGKLSRYEENVEACE